MENNAAVMALAQSVEFTGPHWGASFLSCFINTQERKQQILLLLLHLLSLYSERLDCGLFFSSLPSSPFTLIFSAVLINSRFFFFFLLYCTVLFTPGWCKATVRQANSTFPDVFHIKSLNIIGRKVLFMVTSLTSSLTSFGEKEEHLTWLLLFW